MDNSDSWCIYAGYYSVTDMEPLWIDDAKSLCKAYDIWNNWNKGRYKS